MADYAALLEANPKATAKKYSFCPDDDAAGYGRPDGTALDGAYTGFRFTTVGVNQRIARVQFEKYYAFGRGTVLRVKPTLDRAAAGTPAYFLPWDARGAAVELTIPRRNPDLPAATHPRFFFTAALSGCTILFRGTADNPTIYHCGTAGGKSGTDTTGNANVFFASLLAEAKRKGLGNTAGTATNQVNSTDYMNTTKLPSAGVGTTERQFRQAINNEFHRRAVAEHVGCWGAVFGIRTGVNWKFYLQQNATIQLYTLEEITEMVKTKEKVFGPFHKTVMQPHKKVQKKPGQPRVFSKPVFVQQVFPGTGVAKMSDAYKSIL
jgi:hypothetical protein